jgi:hypothetical protein
MIACIFLFFACSGAFALKPPLLLVQVKVTGFLRNATFSGIDSSSFSSAYIGRETTGLRATRAFVFAFTVTWHLFHNYSFEPSFPSLRKEVDRVHWCVSFIGYEDDGRALYCVLI